MTKNPLQTPAGNYLLRSKRSESLIMTMQLAKLGRIAPNGGTWTHTDTKGEWVANCGWNVRALVKSGLLFIIDGGVALTGAGHDAYDAVVELKMIDQPVPTIEVGKQFQGLHLMTVLKLGNEAFGVHVRNETDGYVGAYLPGVFEEMVARGHMVEVQA